MTDYKPDRLDALLLAVIEEAANCVNLPEVTGVDYRQALEAARWLDTEGRDWMDTLGIGVSDKEFTGWLELSTARWMLANTAHLTTEALAEPFEAIHYRYRRKKK